MSNHCRLSFARINFLSPQISEIIIDKDVVMSLEMAEELEQFIKEHHDSDFGVLVNKINNYDYEFEARLTIASSEPLKAIAVVTYRDIDAEKTKELIKQRAVDNWNIKTFSGLELGWQQAKSWLEHQLN